MPSPTRLTLERLRRDGYAVDIVERWIAQARIRRDLFHCIDLVAIKPGEPVLGIQATAASCVSARLSKARSIPELGTWLATGSKYQVWGWKKVKDRWHPRIIELQGVDLEPVIVAKPPRKRRRSAFLQGELFG